MDEVEASARARCYFDVSIGGLQSGRVMFELFCDVAPKTCENFRSLCTGEKGLGQTTKKPLYYKGVIFHRVVKDFIIQGGDFTNFNGTGGESIYGGTFEDESFTLQHDKPFLLSMANRGKDTNGSQFFITTQPAPHLDNVHVVFGCVVSGIDVIRQIETLPVDANSRPLQDIKIVKCGELVRQIKVKKEVKKKKEKAREESSSGESSDSSEAEKKSKKKSKKVKKNEKKEKKKIKKEDDSEEEGEVTEGDSMIQHPLVTVSNINPEDIPDVPVNKFLMRGGNIDKEIKKEKREKKDHRDRSPRDRRKNDWNNRGYGRRDKITTKSGRTIKGRGVFRYRTPSRSRSRSTTPIHWKKEEARTMKLSDYERKEQSRKEKANDFDFIKKEGIHSPIPNRKPVKEFNDNDRSEVDYNALDYEDNENQSDEETAISKKQIPSLVQYPLNTGRGNDDNETMGTPKRKENDAQDGKMIQNKRSEVLAMALGVQIKSREDPPTGSITISGYSKKNKSFKEAEDAKTSRRDQEVNLRLLKLAGQPIVKEKLNDFQAKRSDRNKFEIEKRDIGRERRHSNSQSDANRRRPDWNRRDNHRPAAQTSRHRNYREPERKRKSRSPQRRRRSRSRSHDRNRHSRSPRSRQDRSSSRQDKKIISKNGDSKDETNVEKLRRRAEQILLLKKKMEQELIEMQRKREEEEKQSILEEKQRKAKEEAKMLDKAKRAKREAIEKEKLLKTVKALQELDKKTLKKRRSSSSSSSSSHDSEKFLKRRPKTSTKKSKRCRSSSSSSRSRSRTPPRKDRRR